LVEVTLIAAFVAGVISFLSPCVLPLIPGFLAYLSGTRVAEAKNARMKLFLNSLSYVLGFAVVFSILGVLLNTLLEGISYSVQAWLSRVGGAIIILFGLYTIGLVKLPFLEMEYKITPRKRFSATYLTSFVFGASFAVGWTPCVGAVLGSVLTLAVTQPGLSFALLLTYSIGLGIPFLLVGLFSKQALGLIKRLGPALKYFNIVVGILLVVLGILVFTQTLNVIANLPFILG
jgi:cytochrome c-type biogenesis protein